MDDLQQIMDKIDSFINKDSFLITDKEMDDAMSNWNLLFDKANFRQEQVDIEELTYNNERASS